jgi:dimethylhistidine N-methyltransferase
MRPATILERSPSPGRLETAGFLHAVLQGLQSRPKTLPCKYLYDAEGSRLFEEICELEEYYVTRTEHGILREHCAEIAARCGPDCLLIELGSGSSTKTRRLLDQLDTPAAYVPIDIAREQLDLATEQLRREYPWLEVLPLCADYHRPFELPSPARTHRRSIVFFPGSTLGNFEPHDAREFLRSIAAGLQPGDALIIGVDLVKARETLEQAYDDAAGVTARFNLNLLHRINRELGADFVPHRFWHRAIFNSTQSRIEMHLVSTRRQTVRIDGATIPFDRNECIVTEHSYKYTVDGFGRLAGESGFVTQAAWTDARQWFGEFFLVKSD